MEAAREERGEKPRLDVKSEVARALIEAMERGDAPWQKPWDCRSMSPQSLATGNEYKGVNRLLLSMGGWESPHFCTFAQAAQRGWNVRKGERGTMVVKLIELQPERQAEDRQEGGSDASKRTPKALMRYYVFNVAQLENPPAIEPAERDFDPIERVDNIEKALRERTGLKVTYGKKHACYDPVKDEIQMPRKAAFKSRYDMGAVFLHEAAHSSMHASRLARRDALGERWGDEAYAMEELRAEISSCVLAQSCGLRDPLAGDTETQTREAMEKHVQNHAMYLKHWVAAIKRDPLAIFAAARDAEKISEYLLVMERELVAMEPHKEWVRDFEQTYAVAR